MSFCGWLKKMFSQPVETPMLQTDISECFTKVHNRGVIPFDVMQEIIEHVKKEPDSVFAVNDKKDIYSNVFKELGPWTGIAHRKAVMCEVLRVLGGFESSWNWLEGRDMSADNTSVDTQETGMFQCSYNSTYFTGKEYMESLLGKTDGKTFIADTKTNHEFAIGHVIRVLRNTVNHHGPVKRKEINKWLKRSAVEQIQKQLGAYDKRPSPSTPASKLKRCPFAINGTGMKAQGSYRKGYPEGAIVHFTAGSSIESSLSWGHKQGYMFFGIGRDGKLYQNFDLDKWGYHAGSSSWPSLGRGVSRYLVGIEIASAGKLSYKNGKWTSYFGSTPDKTRTIKTKRYNQEQTGTYEAYTDAQEKTLIELLTWLKHNNPEVFSCDLILGHDEVSPGRKNDPGGALSMSMPKLRETMKGKV